MGKSKNSPAELQAEIQSLRRRIKELEKVKEENGRLRKQLDNQSPDQPESPQATIADPAGGKPKKGETRRTADRQDVGKEVAEERNMLRAIVENLPYPIYVKDSECRFALVNSQTPKAAHISSPEEMIGNSDYDFYAPEYAEMYQSEEREIIRTGKSIVGMERMDPSGLWYSVTKVPYYNSEGRIVGLVGINQDIQKRKEAEAALLKAHEDLEKRVAERTSELTRANRQLQDEIVERKRVAEVLRQNQEAEKEFQNKLTILLELSLDLSHIESVDALCRQAVEAGCERLDFDRLGIWFVDKQGGKVTGTYGIDEQGRLRDERGIENKLESLREDLIACLNSSQPIAFRTEGLLLGDHHARVVGEGTRVSAAIWDGRRVIGYIACDNLLSHRPMTNHDSELLTLYASALGQLVSLKQAEQQIRRERDFNKRLVQTSPAFIVIIDTEGRLRMLNQAMLKALGYSEEEVVGKDYLETFVPPEEHESLKAIFRNIIDHCQSTTNENYVLTKDGRRLLVEWHGQPVIKADGELDYFFGMGIDITERKKAEEALRESEEMYRNLYETALVGLWQTRIEDGKVLKANKTTAEITGYANPQEMMEQAYTTDFFPHQQRQQFLDMLYKHGEVSNYEMHFNFPNGREIDANISGKIFPEKGYVEGAVVDITETKRLQQQLLQAQKLESIGTLAGGIAHDFNNLSAVIVGNASVLQRQAGLPQRVQDALEDIMDASERGSSLTQQLLAYARGGLQKPVATDLKQVVKSVLKILERTAPPQINLLHKPAERVPAVVVDATQIEQVIMNLCLNAIQASEAPSIIEISTFPEQLDEEKADSLNLEPALYVCLQVTDQGCGMDEETIQRIFDPFFTTKFTGRGMGLAATQGIVQSHGGQIRVDSSPGGGTTMSIWLPAAEEHEEVVDAASLRPKPVRAPRGTETVLIIDDEAAVCKTVEKILAPLGYLVISHSDTDEAGEFVRRNGKDIDLVLLDLNMPKCAGDQMYARIRQFCPDIPVLLISGFDKPDVVNKLQETGAGPFVQKPFAIVDLAITIREAIDASGPRSKQEEGPADDEIIR